MQRTVGFRKRIGQLPILAIRAFSVLVLLNTLWTSRPYLFDVASHFTLHAAAALILLGLAICLIRKWRKRGFETIVLGAIVFGLATWRILPSRSPDPAVHASSPGRTLRIVSYNMKWTPDHDDEGFLRWLKEVDPDLVCLMASNTQLITNDAWLNERFTSRVSPQRGAWWPIILLSRIDAERRRLAPNAPDARPSFVARRSLVLDLGDSQSLLFTGMRPPSPRTIGYWRDALQSVRRDGQIISAYANRTGVDVIVAGDFNSTPFGRVHREFSATSGLTPWAPFPPRGTWPTRVPSILSLPIDRIWMSENVSILQGTVGPKFGSDHHPVLIEVVVERRK